MRGLLVLTFLFLESSFVMSQDCSPSKNPELFQTFGFDENDILQFCQFNWYPVCSSSAINADVTAAACKRCGATDLCTVDTNVDSAAVTFSAVTPDCQSAESIDDCTPTASDCPEPKKSVRVTCTPQDNPGSAGSASIGNTCPEDWIFSDVTGKCYKFITQGMNWFKAFEACILQDYDANLVRIQSPEEMEILRTIINNDIKLLHFVKFWTAANDIVQDDKWSYAPENVVATFDNSEEWGWAKGEPNNSNKGNERCANLLGIHGRDYYMNDAGCFRKGAPICEMQAI